MRVLAYLKNRFLEASTWAGLGVAFTAGAAIMPKLIIGAVVCGGLAVMMPDYTPKEKPSGE